MRRPHLAPGGWAFEFENDNYPDIDDTAEVILALRAAAGEKGYVVREVVGHGGATTAPRSMRGASDETDRSTRLSRADAQTKSDVTPH